MKRLVLSLPLVGLLVLAWFLWQGLFINPKGTPQAWQDKPFPQFHLKTLAAPQREVVADDLRGNVTLVNVWASWCEACAAEQEFLMELKKSAPFKLVGINWKDQPGDAKQFLIRLGNPFSYNLLDTMGQLGIDLGLYGVPETFLVDRAGHIRYRLAGPLTRQTYQRYIKPKLAGLNG